MLGFSRQLVAPFLFILLAILAMPLRAEPFVLIDGGQLEKLKTKLTSEKLSEAQQSLVNRLLTEADSILSQPNPTVMSKTILPPTKDKHDYLSISRYWWPDPTKEDGLPWIRKDGQTNPDTQTEAVDRPNLGRVTFGVRALAVSYFLTGEGKYADKAASMIRTWFIDDKTRMNPHLSFAQSVPGNPKMRRSGILDGRLIPEHILDAISLIADSGYWSQADQQAMRLWLSDYLTWLTESKVGKQGAKQTNNHGSWYRFQVAALAYYLGKQEVLKEAVNATKQSLSYQFDALGVQEHEVKRTRSFFYSCFNLRALLSVAIVADKAGLGFWDYQTDDKRSLQLGIDYLTPVIDGKPWPHKTKGVKLASLAQVLAQIAEYYPNAGYDKQLTQIWMKNTDTDLKYQIQRKLLLRRPDLVLLD